MTATAVQAAKRRHQTALGTLYGSTVSIGGTSYAAAVILSAIKNEMNEIGNWERKQRLTATIRKTLLTSAPARKTVLIHAGVSFMIDGDTGGQNTLDTAWVLHASRKLPSPS